MNKRIIIRLALIIMGAIAILGILMAITTMPNENNNGFVRKWANEGLLEPKDTFHLAQELTMIVGESDHSIFIAGKSPEGILIINKITREKKALKLSLKVPQDKLVPFYIKIDSPSVFLHLNNMQLIIDGKVSNTPFKNTKIKTGVFLKSLQISDSIALITSPDTTFQYQNFHLVNLRTGEYKKSHILNDDTENALGLSNDGILLFDKKTQTIVYLEYFRNKFYCLDTNLITKYIGKTIDSVSTVELNLSTQTKNDSTNKLSPASARITVNANGFVENGNLYVISGLRADNQSIKNFNSHINIDVYDVTNGSYKFSFLIKKQPENKLKSILVSKDVLYTLSNNELGSYKMNF